MHAVKVEQFEGPLDVLLSLIQEEKLDITAVSLASVADQYLERLAQGIVIERIGFVVREHPRHDVHHHESGRHFERVIMHHPVEERRL